MEVSVRDLKEHLSQYLRLVQTGQPVLITRHDRPVARLEPVCTAAGADALERLKSASGVFWAGGKPQGSRIRLGEGTGNASDAVLEDRR